LLKNKPKASYRKIKKMKIFITGTRGIPDIPGGVEKHCQELYPRIVALGHKVTIATRKSYVKTELPEWRGVDLKHIYSPQKKSLEAIIHTFLSVIEAKKSKADILHIHAVGPGLLVPFAKLLGLKVVVTNHGPDYDRQKWGRAAKLMLRLGEWLGGRLADEVIVISGIIEDIILKRCRRASNVIYNGVNFPEGSDCEDFLHQIGVKPGSYVLAVSRFVPEKGLDLLIRSFSLLNTDYKLVIAGDADHTSNYSKKIKERINENPNIIGTGYITGKKLNQIYSNAGLFVLPSFHEGLPIALLEALSYGIPVLVSDIPANKEIDLPNERFFKCGDVTDLKRKLEQLIGKDLSEKEKYDIKQLLEEKYKWDLIAERTIEVYNKALRR